MLSYAGYVSKSVVYNIDLEEKEPLEKTEKNPLDGKEKNEAWMMNTLVTETRHPFSAFSFLYYKESNSISPYFEICPRPPEQ